MMEASRETLKLLGKNTLNGKDHPKQPRLSMMEHHQ